MHSKLFKKTFVLLAMLIVPAWYFSLMGTEPTRPGENDPHKIYMEMGLDGMVSYSAFERAMEGYLELRSGGKQVLTVIDFSKPSNVDRLFVFDMAQHKILMHSLVAHGKGSGEVYAISFSNKSGSKKSSIGFFRTGAPYDGRNGYSLALNGLEKGINDQVLARGVVIHAADYCNPSFLASNGRLGRSLGCPAVPVEMNEEVIDAIQGGTLLYIYANDPTYMSKSTILSGSTIAALAK